jgi:hypothetical protein
VFSVKLGLHCFQYYTDFMNGPMFVTKMMCYLSKKCKHRLSASDVDPVQEGLLDCWTLKLETAHSLATLPTL